MSIMLSARQPRVNTYVAPTMLAWLDVKPQSNSTSQHTLFALSLSTNKLQFSTGLTSAVPGEGCRYAPQ